MIQSRLTEKYKMSLLNNIDLNSTNNSCNNAHFIITLEYQNIKSVSIDNES